MAVEELHTVRLRDDFYKDGFRSIMIALAIMSTALFILLATSIFLFVKKPNLVVFGTDNDWRIFPPVPVTQPYVGTPDLLQWASGILPQLFTYDFTNYADALKSLQQYFTPDGWTKLNAVLTSIAGPDAIQANKQFVQATPTGAPVIINQGVLENRYSWWVQMPVTVKFTSINGSLEVPITMQALIVRMPTNDNLAGIAIDNVIVTKDQPGQAPANVETAPT